MHISLFFKVNYYCFISSLNEVGNLWLCYCFTGLVSFPLLPDQLTLMQLSILVQKYTNFLLWQYRAQKGHKLTAKSQLQSLQSILVFIEVIGEPRLFRFLTEIQSNEI